MQTGRGFIVLARFFLGQPRSDDRGPGDCLQAPARLGSPAAAGKQRSPAVFCDGRRPPLRPFLTRLMTPDLPHFHHAPRNIPRLICACSGLLHDDALRCGFPSPLPLRLPRP